MNFYDAQDSKSSSLHGECGFDSLLILIKFGDKMVTKGERSVSN